MERESIDPADSAEWTAELHRLLRQLASRHLVREGNNITFQATELVHEAYLRMAELEMPFQDKEHFVRMTSTMMRRVLVDHARKKCRVKRGERPLRVTLQTADALRHDDGFMLLELDSLLEALHKIDPRKAKIAEVYYFAGLTQEETATALEISPSTVVRELRFIKAWLGAQLTT